MRYRGIMNPTKMMSLIRKLLRWAPAIAAMIATLVSTSGCDRRENKFIPPPPPQVTVSRPVRQAVTDYLYLTGNTQAVDQVQLQARIEGFLTSIHFTDGDYVKKGDLLFLIEQAVYQAKVQQAEGQLAAVQAQLLRANQEYDRQVSLVKQNATPKADVEKWRAERDAAQAKMTETKANLELARINLGYTRVTAPFDGRMDRHLVTPGNLVGAAGPTPLADITRMDPIYAYFTLNERDLIRLMEKRRETAQMPQNETAVPVFASIKDSEEYPFKGQLDFVSSSLDPNTGTILLRAVFSNPKGASGVSRLIPGMFVRLRIPVEVRERALLVPERALGVDQNGRYLLVVNDQDVVDQRPVKVGAGVDGMRVVEEGLQADDWVVVSNLQRARPGAKVTPVKQEAAPAAATSTSK
jgi:multidrug efflux system membrane fusion protein